MIIWAFVVFGFGIVLFLVYILNLFGTFAPWIWSILLFIIAIGMLNRIWHKEKEGEKEKLAEMVAELEEKLKEKKD